MCFHFPALRNPARNNTHTNRQGRSLYVHVILDGDKLLMQVSPIALLPFGPQYYET